MLGTPYMREYNKSAMHEYPRRDPCSWRLCCLEHMTTSSSRANSRHGVLSFINPLKAKKCYMPLKCNVS